MGALQQTFLRPHFHFNPKDEKAAEFAGLLIAELGNFEVEEADAIVNIGGDGTILRSLHVLDDKPNFALKPPTSNSALFHGHHNIKSADELKRVFEAATAHKIHPMIAEINFSDGTSKIIRAYADVTIRSFNAQATLSHEALDNQEPKRIMGGGWILATPLGCTALNETHGGKLVQLGEDAMVVTIHGVSDKRERDKHEANDYMSRVVRGSSRQVIEVSSSNNKRLTCVDFDSYTMFPDSGIFDQEADVIVIRIGERHIQSISVTTDYTQSRQLLINPEFQTPRPF